VDKAPAVPIDTYKSRGEIFTIRCGTTRLPTIPATVNPDAGDEVVVFHDSADVFQACP
jgi:hypothetical protein